MSMFHKPDFMEFKFVGQGVRATTRSNCTACGKRIQWRGGHDAFFFSGRDAVRDETWNTKSDRWRMTKGIPIKGCERGSVKNYLFLSPPKVKR